MRSVIDKLVSWTGLVLAVVLLVAGSLLLWANQFVGDQVHEQLAMQDITMPTEDRLETPEQKEALAEYAGEQLTTGPQAKAFADHYILEHMNAASEGRTYEEVSGEFIALSADENADPDEVAALGQLRQTLFMGNTLRGLLLNAYAFSMMGTIAGWAAAAAFIGAVLLAALAALGFRHSRKAAAVETVQRETVRV